jgi:3-oxoacyl-[acyl-carrier protein] reductase/bacilysin biosynthesis oxidoreductase BacG
MDLKLSGKVAIVTGGSAGIGLACVQTLLEEGANVVIAARRRSEEAVEAIEKSNPGFKNRVIPAAIDLSEENQAETVVKLAMDNFQKVDILINCAGAARAGAFLELSDQDFIDAWTLKTLGYIRMVKAVLPSMIARGDGRIVNIIGAAGRTPSAAFLAGSTANAALINFTRGLSKDLAGHNVRINAISPAATETERARLLALQTAEAKGVGLEEVMAETTRNIPLGRMIKPSEIAALAAFLVSDLAASITGAEILVDGGQTPGI